MLRAVLGAAMLCGALLVVLALSAAPAFASRAFEAKIPNVNGAFSVAIEKGDYVWVTDTGQASKLNPGNNGVYKYAPYPSITQLGVPNTYEPFGYYIYDLTAAVDDATGEVYVAQSNGRVVYIFAPLSSCKSYEAVCYTHSWTRINGANTCFNCLPDIHIAIDNSGTYSEGRIYLSLTSPENDIEMLDFAQRPVDFPATASYITNNRLTGTPSGHFGQVANITVDTVGNIYVTDVRDHYSGGEWVATLDEFDSSGTFLRKFPDHGQQGYPGAGGAGVDPTNGNVLITGPGVVEEFDSSGNHLANITSDGGSYFQVQAAPAVNSNGYVYVPSGAQVDIFGPAPAVPKVSYAPVSGTTATAGVLHATIDPNGGGEVTQCEFEYGTSTSYGTKLPCSPAVPFTSIAAVSAEISGLTTDTTYHYRVVVHNGQGVKYGADQTYTPHLVLGLRTEAVTNLTEAGATLNASFVGNGEATSYEFEWGAEMPQANEPYEHASPASSVTPGAGSKQSLSFALQALVPYTTYHYRVVAEAGGHTSYGEDQMFTTPPGIPSVVHDSATIVHADRAVLHGIVNPNGAPTSVYFEYVTDAEYRSSGFATATKTSPEIEIGMSRHAQTVSTPITELQAGTIYHYRAVGTNEAGVGVPSKDYTFITFPFQREISDQCPNAHVRQQTGTALLLDCRAYELVSAANAGGYDVESSLVPGETPFANYPGGQAASGEPQVLYGVHSGGIPGSGDPTNRGVDPYVATRTGEGWKTRYVGIPAHGTPSTSPFSSTLAEADASLNTFDFGGPEICSPCFPDGSTGSPIHLPNGELVQGMTGSEPQPTAKPAGFIGRRLSADGTHFVFGSTSKFEADGNQGSVSIYDRNLMTKVTHVVSKTPTGGNLPCITQCTEQDGWEGIGELDISSDGSRIVVGQLVSKSGGARYWNLYMNVGDSTKTTEISAPNGKGAGKGVLYDGMKADGSKVFFTSTEQLTPADKDNSADIYMWSAEGGEEGHLTLVSLGNYEESGQCDPSANTANEHHWNTTGTEKNCGVVAVGGRGGVASNDGTIFFLSPEQLEGHGVLNAPNLYVVRPGQQPQPQFVATLESTANAPLPLPKHTFVRTYGSFENPTGVAIDHATGDVYVLDVSRDIGQGFLYKYTPNGEPVRSFGVAGKLIVAGMIGFYNDPTEIAVDNDPTSPSYRDVYVPEIGAFQTMSYIKKYNFNGEYVTKLGPFPQRSPLGVGVDPANGNVYIPSFFGGENECGQEPPWWEQNSGLGKFSRCGMRVFDAEGNELSHWETIGTPGPQGVAVDSAGHAYTYNGGGQAGGIGSTEEYDSSGNHIATLNTRRSFGVAVDPTDDHVFVDEGEQVTEFDSSGNQVGAPSGFGTVYGPRGVLSSVNISHSIGLAADSGTVVVSNPPATKVVTLGPLARPFDPETDNPLVMDSVTSPGLRNTEDFQVTPSGNDVAFTSALPLTGYDSGQVHREIYRWDAVHGLECPSCNQTEEQATGDAALPPNGLGLSNDGRVFFDSTEGLVDRDLNEREDAYQWEPKGFEFGEGAPACTTGVGCVQLISTGTSPFASSLLGISADATDAYFFTRDKLVEEDQNGSTVKIYDARSLGGYPYVFPEPQCKASDECHGPGTPQPPPPNIKTVGPTPGNGAPANCRRGFVKKHGKCVRKPRKPRRHHHRKAHRHG